MTLLNISFSQLNLCLALAPALALDLPMYRGSSHASSKLNLEALDLNGLKNLLPISLDHESSHARQ